MTADGRCPHKALRRPQSVNVALELDDGANPADSAT
jgi:hypothetical protein